MPRVPQEEAKTYDWQEKCRLLEQENQSLCSERNKANAKVAELQAEVESLQRQLEMARRVTLRDASPEPRGIPVPPSAGSREGTAGKEPILGLGLGLGGS